MLLMRPTFQLVEHSDWPEASFTQLVPSAGVPGASAVSDRSLEWVLRALSAYSSRPQQSMAVQGSKWRLADFRLGVGAAVSAGVVRGVVLEAEYCPAVSAGLGFPLLKELLNELFPRLGAVPPPFPPQHRLEPQDTVTQYLRVFAALARTSAQQPPAQSAQPL